MDKAKILIVEDEILVARDLQLRLTEMGYTVPSVATTGMQAIQNIKAELPDIVLMDIILQGKMDGIETADIIHSEFDVPVIYLTAHGEEATFIRAKETFPYGYVIKPFTNDDIKRTIEMALYKLSFEQKRKKLIEQLRKEISERKRIEEFLKERTEQIIKHQEVLLRLSKQNYTDLESMFKRITEVDSKTLELERVSIWFFNKDHSEIVCKDLYIRGKDLHEAGLKLHARDYPIYFNALNECRILAANDACNDPLTGEFTEGYLKPYGITSMLDVPIRLHGKMIGIVCHEHTGLMREWTKEEEDFSASIAGMVSLAMEVNERQKMEERLLQSEKLKAMGVITAGIAHEFSNILAIISGNIQMMERKYKNNNQLADKLKIIKMATNDGAQVSSRMLKFTKIKKDTAGFVSSDPRDLIKHAIDFTMPRWKNMAQAKGINYRIEKKGMKDVPSILCNPTELREVFINIINNALDALPGDGCISFSTWSTGNNIVFISITDTGEGMSEEVKKYIFDPFFTTKLPMGSGLGMSTVFGIINRHGGKIEVESELGKGTIFTLQFPTDAKMDNTVVNSEPLQSTQCKRLHILVVDDEINVGKLLDEYLSDDGHNVKTVDNGADAIKLSKRESFDLVLCDLAMPNVSGYDVIKALNKLDKCPKIGIITGCDEELILLKEKNLKVDFLINKPFDLTELTRHISDQRFKD